MGIVPIDFLRDVRRSIEENAAEWSPVFGSVEARDSFVDPGGTEHVGRIGGSPVDLISSDSYYFRDYEMETNGTEASAEGNVETDNGNARAELTSNATSGDYAEVAHNEGYGAEASRPNFNNRMIFRTEWNISATANTVAHCTHGFVADGDRGFGFRFEGGDVQLIASDGTNTSTTTISTDYYDAQYGWSGIGYVEFLPGEKVHGGFWDLGDVQGGAFHSGEVTTSLPSGEWYGYNDYVGRIDANDTLSDTEHVSLGPVELYREGYNDSMMG